MVIRCLRPDRMTIALINFIKNTLPFGDTFVDLDQKSSFTDILASVI